MCFLHLWGYQINRSCDRFPAVLKISAYDGTSLIASSHPQPPLFPAEEPLLEEISSAMGSSFRL